MQVKTKHSGVQFIPFTVVAIALLSSERALYRIFHDNAYSPHQFKTVCSPRTLYNEGNIYFQWFLATAQADSNRDLVGDLYLGKFALYPRATG